MAINDYGDGEERSRVWDVEGEEIEIIEVSVVWQTETDRMSEMI
jgi:hypothetical protein